MSAAATASLIRRRAISPVEVMEDAIGRIEARNPSLNALVYTAFDEARARAREAEKAVLAGEPLGPLHGVPVAIKDLFDFKPGWPATLGGIRALKNFTVNASCVFADRIERRGGAIVVGKTNSPTMGFRGTCDNCLFGCTRNPFDTTRNSGGSSGGSIPEHRGQGNISDRAHERDDRHKRTDDRSPQPGNQRVVDEEERLPEIGGHPG